MFCANIRHIKLYNDWSMMYWFLIIRLNNKLNKKYNKFYDYKREMTNQKQLM